MASADRILREALATRFEKNDRKETQQPERRPSTIIDEDGCIIQRGFLIPNRTSPSHSRSSRPATPTYKPIQAFERPTGSLFDAPEMRILANKYPGSLHRPTKSAGDLEGMTGCRSRPPAPERRQTWQTGAISSVWSAEELADTSYVPVSGSLPHCENKTTFSTGRPAPTAKHVHRSKGVQQNLHALGDEQSKTCDIKQLEDKDDQKKNKSTLSECLKLVSSAEAEDAIASDSEDEDDDKFAGIATQVAVQRKRVSYAERRMRQDERAAEEHERRIIESNTQEQLPQKLRLVPADQHESAIESDDEDDEVAEALRMATLHTDRNLIAASPSATERQSEDGRKRKTSKETGHRASLSVKITSNALTRLGVAGADGKDGVTPRHIKSFETDAPIPCRKLRPSKSRPRPVKGVLKKSGSPSSSSSSSGSSSKHVKTTKRPSFASMCKDAMMPTVSALTQIQTYWQKPRS